MADTNESMAGPRRRRTAEEKAALVAAYAQREVTQAEFCRQNGLSPATLAAWVRAGTDDGPRAAGGGGFVELAPMGGFGGGVRVEAPGGLTLHIESGTDPFWAGRLLACLRCGA
jgi:hypothetical protein